MCTIVEGVLTSAENDKLYFLGKKVCVCMCVYVHTCISDM